MTSNGRSSSRLVTVIRLVVALGLSLLTLAWAMHDVDLSQVGGQLARSSVSVVLLVLFAQLLQHLIRVIRWWVLIRPLGPVSFREVFAAATLGAPATFFLPLRLGEFVRPIMVKRCGVPFAGAMASVVVERVADGVVTLGLFFLMIGLLPEVAAISDELRTFAFVTLGIFGGGVVVLVVTCVMKAPALRLIGRILRPLSAKLAERVLGLLENFVEGAVVLGHPLRLLTFVGLTAVLWGLAGASAWLLADSYIPGVPPMIGPFTASVTVFAIMIPAGPAFAGTLEVGFRFGMAPFGISGGEAAAVALAFHAIQLVVMALLAGVGFVSAEPRQTARLALTGQPEVEDAGEIKAG